MIFGVEALNWVAQDMQTALVWLQRAEDAGVAPDKAGIGFGWGLDSGFRAYFVGFIDHIRRLRWLICWGRITIRLPLDLQVGIAP